MHCYYMCVLCSTVDFLSMILTQFIINIANYHHLSANLIRKKISGNNAQHRCKGLTEER